MDKIYRGAASSVTTVSNPIKNREIYQLRRSKNPLWDEDVKLKANLKLRHLLSMCDKRGTYSLSLNPHGGKLIMGKGINVCLSVY